MSNTSSSGDTDILTLTNAGTEAYMVTYGSSTVTVNPFSIQTLDISASTPLMIYVHFKSGLSVPVVFNAAGQVVSPSWVNEISNGTFFKNATITQIVRSTGKPFELKVYTAFCGVPWFCWVSLAVLLALIILAVVLGCCLGKRAQKSRRSK